MTEECVVAPGEEELVKQQAGIWLAQMDTGEFDRGAFVEWLSAAPTCVHKVLDQVIWHQWVETLVSAPSRAEGDAPRSDAGENVYRRVLEKLNG